jgi:hypothetical protein
VTVVLGRKPSAPDRLRVLDHPDVHAHIAMREKVTHLSCTLHCTADESLGEHRSGMWTGAVGARRLPQSTEHEVLLSACEQDRAVSLGDQRNAFPRLDACLLANGRDLGGASFGARAAPSGERACVA